MERDQIPSSTKTSSPVPLSSSSSNNASLQEANSQPHSVKRNLQEILPPWDELRQDLIAYGQGPYEKPSRRKVLLLFFFLALLMHILFLRIPFKEKITAPHPPVELQSIDSKQLKTIRKQWKEKTVILDDGTQVPSTEVPPEARYQSKENRRVEKEQRAQWSQQFEKSGRPLPSQKAQSNSKKQSKAQKKTAQTPFPNLADLALPMNLTYPHVKSPSEPPVDHASSSDQISPSPTLGDQQNLLDTLVPFGSENLLNSQRSIYYSFYARMTEAIVPIWMSKARMAYSEIKRAGTYVTLVDVVLNREGIITNIHELQSSGIKGLDQAVLNSWKQIKQIPNPPKALIDPHGEIHLLWSFTAVADSSAGVIIGPPRRLF